MILIRIGAFALIAISISGCATLPPASRFVEPTNSEACSTKAYGALESWLGSWRATDVATGVDAGRATITSELGGCLIFERWLGLDARGTPYNGIGEHRYDRKIGKWVQTWVDDRGEGQRMEGDTQPQGGVTYEWRLNSDGSDVMNRQYITPLADGRYSNRGARSIDNGVTWQQTFSLVYDRVSHAR